MKIPRQSQPRRMAGLSLVELMISITLGLMVLAAVVTVFANASSARTELERSSRQIENGRYASEVLSDDLRLAGYYGELDVSSVAVPAGVPDPCSLTASDWDSAIPLHVQGYDTGTGFPGTCIPANRKAGTDILVVRRARTCVDGTAGCTAGSNAFVQASMCQSEVATHVIGTAGFTLLRKDCATVAVKRQYYVNIYYIATDNGAAPAQSIPTLTRLELTGSGPGWTAVPLVEGIEELNVVHGLDTDGDGAPDVYVANPNNYPAGACNAVCQVTNWRNVVTAQFYVLSRTLDASAGHSDAKTYTIGNDAAGAAVTVGPFGDPYRRHVYSGLVRIKNPAGRRDTP